MPIYRLTPPGELIEADDVHVEGIHTVLRGVTLVIGKPQQVVIRRVPSSTRVEVVDEADAVNRLSGPPLV